MISSEFEIFVNNGFYFGDVMGRLGIIIHLIEVDLTSLLADPKCSAFIA